MQSIEHNWRDATSSNTLSNQNLPSSSQSLSSPMISYPTNSVKSISCFCWTIRSGYIVCEISTQALKYLYLIELTYSFALTLQAQVCFLLLATLAAIISVKEATFCVCNIVALTIAHQVRLWCTVYSNSCRVSQIIVVPTKPIVGILIWK